MYLSRIYIQLKESVLDPQGQAVIQTLHDLNHKEVEDVRIGKYIELKLNAGNKQEAEASVKKYCDTLLSNPVIETYQFEVESLEAKVE